MTEQTYSYRDEMFVDDDGSPGTVWLTAGGRPAIEAARLVSDYIGLDDDEGFDVARVYGVIEPTPDGARFRKVEADRASETVPMWEVTIG